MSQLLTDMQKIYDQVKKLEGGKAELIEALKVGIELSETCIKNYYMDSNAKKDIEQMKQALSKAEAI